MPKEKVLTDLKELMRNAYLDILNESQNSACTLRDAAYTIAIKRLNAKNIVN